MIKRVVSFLLLFVVSANAQSIHQSEYERQEKTSEEQPVQPSFKPTVPRASTLTKQSYGFHPYWSSDTISKYYRWDLLSTVAFFGAEIAPKTGGIAVSNRWRASTMIDSAHAHGVAVHLTAILFSQHDSLLAVAARRTRAVTSLLALAKERNAEGINIDFEAVPGRLRDSMTAFVRELRDSAGPAFDIVIDIPAVDWNNAFDVVALGKLVDHFFLMAYDYHWRTGPSAGPVAPLDGTGLSIKNSISRYENKSIDMSKVILGLPWYGYDWPTTTSDKEAATLGGATSVTTAYGMQQSEIFGHRYDQVAESPSYVYMAGDTVHQVWYDDPVSLLAKYKYAVQEEMAGIGYWALSYAPKEASMWDAIAAVLGTAGVVAVDEESELLQRIPEDAEDIVIYDVTGRRVTGPSLPGMYFVRFMHDGTSYTIKIIHP
jgi:spore germination protein